MSLPNGLKLLDPLSVLHLTRIDIPYRIRTYRIDPVKLPSVTTVTTE